MEDTLRVLVTVGFTLLLIMLRIEAEKFGAAEYDEPTANGRPPSLRWRIAWYSVGFLLIIAVDVVHPNAGADLLLRVGNGGEAIVFGLMYAVVGTLQAVAFAWLRYRRLRLPPTSLYPGALPNSIGTAFMDEAVFRGFLFAFLLSSGMDAGFANLLQALIYALATRLGAPGRDVYILVLVLFIGLFSGWLTLLTGGIGAAFLGHAVTRFAVFLTTGHAGRIAPPGGEAEDIERRRRTPAGWRQFGGGATPGE